ncbi:transposase [Streptomyces sp. AA4]|nr:transposase [Streptomyces sp. AA4]
MVARSGMTVSPSRSDDPGGGVTGPGGIDRPLIRTRPPLGRSPRNVGAGARCSTGRPPAPRRRAWWMTSGIRVFLGLDVGKGDHHAVGLDPDGKRLHDAPLPNSEPKLRALFDKLAGHGRLLVVVDQPATIGALPVAIARAAGHQVAYLPGLAMRRIADLYPGRAKTDARDAFVIADAARSLPHTLRQVDLGDDALAELDVLVGFDDDLAAEATRLSNRVRGLLTGIHPALERAIGPKIAHPAVLEILSRCGGPAGIRKAGRRNSPRSPSRTRPAWATTSSRRSWPRWTSRPSPSPAPQPPTPSCPGSPTA